MNVHLMSDIFSFLLESVFRFFSGCNVVSVFILLVFSILSCILYIFVLLS